VLELDLRVVDGDVRQLDAELLALRLEPRRRAPSSVIE